MGMKEMRLLAKDSVYLVNINTGIENAIKKYATCLEYQQMQPQENTLPYEITYQPSQVSGIDRFFSEN